MRQTPDFAVCVLGDPINDVYKVGRLYTDREPNRFITTSQFHAEGGAANVAANIEYLLKETPITVKRFYPWQTDYWPKLTRLVADDKILLEYQAEHRGFKLIEDQLLLLPSHRKGLVLADYGKGTINAEPSIGAINFIKRKGIFDFIVIDSRYGTYWPGWLDFAKMKILHATGNELDHHDPTRFNYTFHTNGPDPIRVLHWGDLVATIPVPLQVPVDVTGAGDTFTACIASYLAVHRDQAWDLEFMLEAASYAVPLCQQVIQYLGVGIPDEE